MHLEIQHEDGYPGISTALLTTLLYPSCICQSFPSARVGLQVRFAVGLGGAQMSVVAK